MSCLYSSPEITSFFSRQSEAINPILHRRHAGRSGAKASRARHRWFLCHADFTKNVVTARRAPNSPADVGSCIKSFRLPKQAQDSRVSFQPQYQAFVRSAVGSGTAL
jgi:hypothetical protein